MEIPRSTQGNGPPLAAAGERRALETLNEAYALLKRKIAEVIVGQERAVDLLVSGLFAGGHVILVGVPGLAKTLLANTLARLLSLSFKRVQFTPDLMPSDITGTEVLEEDPETGARRFRFLKGPVFTNVLLADEINRAPPKTQAALLEAMQERQVSVGERTLPLPLPFFVIATQNPIEQEGTYPLPEAQLDRFLFAVRIDYPSREEELEIMKRPPRAAAPDLEPVLEREVILTLQDLVPRVPVAEHVFSFALDLVRRTRPAEPDAPRIVKECVAWGAGPRAAQFLVLGARAWALLRGRAHVSTADVREVALPVLAHRIVTNFHADTEGVTSERILHEVLATLEDRGLRSANRED